MGEVLPFTEKPEGDRLQGYVNTVRLMQHLQRVMTIGLFPGSEGAAIFEICEYAKNVEAQAAKLVEAVKDKHGTAEKDDIKPA